MSEQDPSAVLATLAALQAKTGFVDRKTRPGWTFDLPAILLEQAVQPGRQDPWTAEQRKNGVTVDFVHLTLKEHHRAEGRAGRRYALYGGDASSNPQALVEERTRLSLAAVDGVTVPDNDDDRDLVWEALGKLGRHICMTRYIVATGEAQGEDGENARALEEASAKAAASFRFRV